MTGLGAVFPATKKVHLSKRPLPPPVAVDALLPGPPAPRSTCRGAQGSQKIHLFEPPGRRKLDHNPWVGGNLPMPTPPSPEPICQTPILGRHLCRKEFRDPTLRRCYPSLWISWSIACTPRPGYIEQAEELKAAGAEAWHHVAKFLFSVRTEAKHALRWCTTGLWCLAPTPLLFPSMDYHGSTSSERRPLRLNVSHSPRRSPGPPESIHTDPTGCSSGCGERL